MIEDSAILVRVALEGDAKDIRAMHLSSFGEDSPGALVDDLLAGSFDEISLLAERDGKILGHILFSRLQGSLKALTLAPLAVHPSVQRTGIGSALVHRGLAEAKKRGWQVVFVLGDPAYYQRFGFRAAIAARYDQPYFGPDSMAILLDDNAPSSGSLTFPPAFDEDIKEHRARELARNSSI